ncbi:MAG: macro domain-containing protein [Ignavibacteriae bacterium]|nr:macro domain-containing protein [Ignavibacteriota bacterium]MCB9214610.1 macro domain-containing protein [Ignavibacteria bacterium]
MPLPITLWLVNPDSAMCDAWREAFIDLPNVRVVEGMYQSLEPHDCFVTAGNSFGIMTAGIDAAVIERHGLGLMKRVQERIRNEYLGEQPIGTAFIEGTGQPDYRYIVHAPTMRTPGVIAGTDKVYIATWASLLAIYRHNVETSDEICTVGFPAMGAGFGGVPYKEVARQMATAYKHYLHPPHRMDWDMVIRREKAILP